MMTPERFDGLVDEVWARLLKIIPSELKKHFDKVEIFIEDVPPAHVLAELEGSDLAEHPEELCGLYLGTPLPLTGLSDRGPLPDRVYLFREALLNFSDYDGTRSGQKRLREEIAVTLLHEIGHFFGLEEEDLERLGFD